MKKIRMYNVGFGDCFCLRDRRSNLVVDFGTSNQRIGAQPREQVFDRIISDLSTIPRKNLLLSHFHPDHLSGLLYMTGKRGWQKEFGRIYLPDVFSGAQMTGILTLQLLADLAEGSRLPGRKVSLAALVEALCANPCQISLLRRGTVFEGRYQALWPDTGLICREADALAKELPESARSGWRALYSLAGQMRCTVLSMTEWADGGWKEFLASSGLLSEAGTFPEKETAGQEPPEKEIAGCPSATDGAAVYGRIGRELARRFGQVRKSQEVQQLISCFADGRWDPEQFRHRISVVFQTQKDGELNMLFTGDIPPAYMQRIAENYDGTLPLHEHYWCVKAPHHGTASHYFDFSPYTPDNLLISNGVYYSNSRKQERESRIFGQYSGLFYIEDTTMYCSSSENCEGCRSGCGCTCREHEIIAPRYYRDI